MECGEAGYIGSALSDFTFLVPQAVLRPLQRLSIVRGTLPFFDGFDVVHGPNLRRLMNGARLT